MRKKCFLFKLVIPALLLIGIATTTGCKKENDDKHLAPVGTIAPPDWLIGTWESGALLDIYVVSEDNFIVGIFGFKELTEFANELSQAFGAGTIRMKEIKKTDTEYQVGQEGRPSGGPATTTPSYHFKKGDGTFIEVADYDGEGKKWNEFKKYTKKAE